MNTDLETTEFCANGAQFLHLAPVQGGLLDQPKIVLMDMFNWYAVTARLLYEQRQAENDSDPDMPQPRKTKGYLNMPDTVTEDLFG